MPATRRSDGHQLQAVIFNWSGTTVDLGSRAPAQAFVDLFLQQGISITVAEASASLGRSRREHIGEILATPRVAELWQQVHGIAPSEGDITRLSALLLALQKKTLRRMSQVIPGVAEIVAACRQRGMKIGATTRYCGQLMEVALPIAREGGFTPDVVVTADDVAHGRPAPWMIFRAAERLGVYPMWTIVTVDDTPPGIESGRFAGTWTVAVTKTGQQPNRSDGTSAWSPGAKHLSLATLEDRLRASGAHYLIDGVAGLLDVLDAIETRLRGGERPA